MAVPQIYPVEAGAVASYDFADIAGGTGVEVFETFVVDLSGSNMFSMDTNAIQTLGKNDGGYSSLLENLSPTEEVTFESAAFNLPRIIEGTVYVALTWSVNNATGSNCTITPFVTFYKNSTSLGSQQLTTRTVNNGSTRTTTSLAAIEVARTQISAGDQIKVKFNVVDAPVSVSTRLYHDLNNNDDGTSTPTVTAADNHTNLLIYVPFVVDV